MGDAAQPQSRDGARPDPAANSQFPQPSPAFRAAPALPCPRSRERGHVPANKGTAGTSHVPNSCSRIPRAGAVAVHGPRACSHRQPHRRQPGSGSRRPGQPPAPTEPFQPLNNSWHCWPRPQASCPVGEIAVEGKGNLSRRNRPRPWHVLRAVPLPARQPICPWAAGPVLPALPRLPAPGPVSPSVCLAPAHTATGGGDMEQRLRDAESPALSPPLLHVTPQVGDVGLSPPAPWRKPLAAARSGMREQPAARLGTPSPSWAACYSTA